MKAVIQRVSNAEVSINGTMLDKIEKGFLILLGIGKNDTEQVADKLLSKIVKLRMFDDEMSKTNLSLSDINGEALIISQFTLYADCKRGNRPSFIEAGSPGEAKVLYDYFVRRAKEYIPRVATGEFGAMMNISLTNYGPFTIVLDTENI